MALGARLVRIPLPARRSERPVETQGDREIDGHLASVKRSVRTKERRAFAATGRDSGVLQEFDVREEGVTDRDVVEGRLGRGGRHDRVVVDPDVIELRRTVEIVAPEVDDDVERMRDRPA